MATFAPRFAAGFFEGDGTAFDLAGGFAAAFVGGFTGAAPARCAARRAGSPAGVAGVVSLATRFEPLGVAGFGPGALVGAGPATAFADLTDVAGDAGRPAFVARTAFEGFETGTDFARAASFADALGAGCATVSAVASRGARGPRADARSTGADPLARAARAARSVARDGEFLGTFTRAPDGGRFSARSSHGPE